MKRIHTTNILLGIIAAEVVFLTAQALSKRQADPATGFQPTLAGRDQTPPRSILGGALHRVADVMRGLFSGGRPEMRPVSPREVEERRIPQRPETTRPAQPETSAPQGNLQGLAEKLKDPAWSGALAVNNGNISLTDAERAVPMPGSAQFVERLDRNPFIGGGMKDHSRDHL